jgi:CBS domain-containing protein
MPIAPGLPTIHMWRTLLEAQMALTAADIMTKEVITARPADSVADVAKLLTDHEISAVPVCDEQGRVLGMLSEGDLMRPFGQENALKRAWWLNLLAEGTELAPSFVDYIRLDHRIAHDLMTTPVITANHDTSVPELADLLARHRVKRVPVLRDGKLVGVVSRADVVRALASSPEAVVEPV